MRDDQGADRERDEIPGERDAEPDGAAVSATTDGIKRFGEALRAFGVTTAEAASTLTAFARHFREAERAFRGAGVVIPTFHDRRHQARADTRRLRRIWTNRERESTVEWPDRFGAGFGDVTRPQSTEQHEPRRPPVRRRRFEEDD